MNYNKATFDRAFGISAQLPPANGIEIAFAGRSNVGKSSLLNRLFNRKSLARVSSVPGKTVTVTRSIDGGAFGAGTIGTVTEISAGAYVVAVGAGDMNGTAIVFRFQADGCDDNFVAICPDA